MRKLFTIAAFALLTPLVFGQATRTVLFEEFTQASCGPCASQNPAFNALLNANPTKAVSIKYQTSWPGVDPMNAQNPSEVATRVTYYSVNGVPWTAMDGVAPTGSAYAGAPANVTQSLLDARQMISSSMSIILGHQLTPGNDSIEVAVYVSNALSSTLTSGAAGSLKLHVSIVEKTINFPTAPGSNGETEFHNVMRKMLPDATGTTLPDSWTSSQMQSYNFKVALPSYIYNLGQVAVVAWVQDNSNKEVKNAAYSGPQAVVGNVHDAGVAAGAAPTGGLCNTSFTPSLTLTNSGSTTLTSATVSYTMNGGTPVTQSWSGSLSAAGSVTVSFPSVTLNGGANTFVYGVTSPNGGADYNTMNNTSATLRISTIGATAMNTPYNEGLEAATTTALPAASGLIQGGTSPRLFVISKAVAGTTQNLGGYATSDKSLMFDFYSVNAGGTMSITTQKIKAGTLTSPKLYFQHAHALYDGTEPDQLKVYASTNCGQTWTEIWSKTGNALATHSPVGNNTRFWPAAADWMQNVVSLAAYNSNELILKFDGTSGFGNSLFIDNIWVSNNALGEEERELASVNVFPNPAVDVARIALQLNDNSQVGVSVFSVNGQLVVEIPARDLSAGSHEIAIPVASLANGVYTAQITLNQEIKTVRLSVAH